MGDIKPARQGNNSIRIFDKTRDLALYCSHMDLYRLFSLSEIYTETKQEDIFVKFFIHFTHQECLLSGTLPINWVVTYNESSYLTILQEMLM